MEKLGNPLKKGDRRQAKFVELLNADIISLDKLRSLSWVGIPASTFLLTLELRPSTWKVLLGYLPTSQAIKAEVLARKRAEYADLAALYCTKDGIKGEQSDQDMKSYKQILTDVPRTMAGYELFKEPLVRELLARVLFVWNVRHPASGYVQGINDLCAPFVVVYLSDYIFIDYAKMEYKKSELLGLDNKTLQYLEADIYWSLCKMLEKMQDVYTVNQPGAYKIINKMKEIVKHVDLELYEHIEEQCVNLVSITFRWVNCFFTREFALDKAIRMWDTYFAEAEEMGVFHVYVCASLLLHLKSEIVKKDFSSLVLYLQSLPTMKWTSDELGILLAKSYQLKSFFHKTKHIV
eukprot:TRINITY_DN2038_c0_g2_i2.p1 TRINITY_DN2038_c0_g2~~TRINITY_DN2038_c0_g2_i2.p1  ORF type:complete len:378 (-),score=61.27 TRINITY_DN2038_c0_g2_i2:110-1156(-)